MQLIDLAGLLESFKTLLVCTVYSLTRSLLALSLSPAYGRAKGSQLRLIEDTYWLQSHN